MVYFTHFFTHLSLSAKNNLNKLKRVNFQTQMLFCDAFVHFGDI